MKRLGLLIVVLLASRVDAQRTVSYVCNAKVSSVYLTSGLKHLGEVNRRKKRGWYVEALDVTTLVTTTAEDDPRGFHKVGSRKITRRCGVFNVVITAGWLNGNPYGALGAIEFPLVEVSEHGRQVLRPTALVRTRSGSVCCRRLPERLRKCDRGAVGSEDEDRDG